MTAHEPVVSQPAAEQLAVVLELGRRSRTASDTAELGFIAVNDTHALAPYRQAALWSRDHGVVALSGLVDVDSNAPYAQWLRKLCESLDERTTAGAVTVGDIAEPLREEWAEFFPAYGAWLPISIEDGRASLALLLARDLPWSDRELLLLTEWLDAWGFAYRQATRKRPSWRSRARKLIVGADPAAKWWKRRPSKIAVAALLVCLFPVRLTVLAPGELVPSRPAVMRAPSDGVVDSVLVQPNQTVRRGQPLFRIDTALSASRRDAALEAVAAAEAEYQQAVQQALFDDPSKSRLAGLLGTLEQRRAEADYLSEQAERGTVTAPRDGIVLFDDPSTLVGRPVATGERVMRVADPSQAEIEAWVGVGDAIPLANGTGVRLYLDASPLSPVTGQLRYFSHEAVERPGGQYAYRVRARLEPGERGRIGLRGTAKLNGQRVPLVYWVFRRPLAAVRPYLDI